MTKLCHAHDWLNHVCSDGTYFIKIVAGAFPNGGRY